MRFIKSIVFTVTYLSILYSTTASAYEVISANEYGQKDFALNSLSFKSLISNTENKHRVIKFNNKNYDLELLDAKADKTGKIHTRYRQKYKGIPVYGRQIVQHQSIKKFNLSNAFTGGGSSAKYTGELVNDLDIDLINKKVADNFNEYAALQHAKNLNIDKLRQQRSIDNKNSLIYENEKSELIIYTHDKELKQAKLAYKVSFFVDDVNGNHPMRPNYIIDATNQEIIKYWNSLSHDRVATGPGGNEKIGKYNYGDEMPKLDVREARSGGECFMTNDKVRTIDLKNGYYGIKTYHFPCYDNNNDEVNGAYSAVNDAHYYGEQVFNMYKEWYNKAPLKFKLLMRVHYGTGYENAFWNGSSMTFGDGKNKFYPLVSMDVVAHEVSHGYTEQNSGLEYMGQSGGINEAFSDMAGKAGEYYTFGKNTWNIGDNVVKDNVPIRYMDDPAKDGDSIGDARDYHDALDVHNSSGVFNKAFYLLSTFDNWSIKKAFDVFVHANTYYWTENTDYVDGARGVVYSAEDLGLDVSDISSVFKQVGIDCSLDSCKIMPKDAGNKSDESNNKSLSILFD